MLMRVMRRGASIGMTEQKKKRLRKLRKRAFYLCCGVDPVG